MISMCAYSTCVLNWCSIELVQKCGNVHVMSSGPPSRRNDARDLTSAAQRAAREAEREAQREAEVAAFDNAFSDTAARA